MAGTAFPEAELGPAPALLRLAGCSGKQAAASAAILLLLVVAAWHKHSLAWLALFGALLAALAIAAALLLLVRLVLPPQQSAQDQGWAWAWAGLAAGVVAGAGGAVLVYRVLKAGLGIDGLGDGRIFGSALALCALLLAFPLAALRRQSQALQMAGLKQSALAAELKSLQAQVEPHFLYNTLANTRYLARHEPEKAVRMLDHLIAYLHTALPDMRTPSSTLGRECELAEHYLALMAIRFGERMSFDVACPAELKLAAMPPLMLMSLVENAVRHGVEAKPGEVRVSVSAAQVGGVLHILVADSGAGLAQTVFGSGVGLRNVRERLAAQFGDSAGFELRTGGEGRTEAELRLPLSWAGAAAVSTETVA
ncbi:sensor histidine kinase [Pseudoduganella aquatica]|uniref:sensor histidine kinase n=1 Tax=Pseudoduganella aquatica TaxID=2660641 RepID=UPI001E3BBD21|nr:histidine kinase [Pseudoduganella aquatica]